MLLELSDFLLRLKQHQQKICTTRKENQENIFSNDASKLSEFVKTEAAPAYNMHHKERKSKKNIICNDASSWAVWFC